MVSNLFVHVGHLVSLTYGQYIEVKSATKGSLAGHGSTPVKCQSLTQVEETNRVYLFPVFGESINWRDGFLCFHVLKWHRHTYTHIRSLTHMQAQICNYISALASDTVAMIFFSYFVSPHQLIKKMKLINTACRQYAELCLI